MAKLQQVSKTRNFDDAHREIDRMVVNAIDMLAKSVPIGEALLALLAGKTLCAIVEGFYMPAEGETGTISLEAVGNRTL